MEQSQNQDKSIDQPCFLMFIENGYINHTMCKNAYWGNTHSLEKHLLCKPIQDILNPDTINFILVCAAWHDNVHIVEMILNHNNLVQKIHADGLYQAFIYAVQKRHIDVVQALVDNTKTSSLLLTHEAKEFEMLYQQIDSTSEENNVAIKKLLSIYIQREKKGRPQMPTPSRHRENCITS